MISFPIQLIRAIPRTVRWVKQQEARIRTFGFPLTAQQTQDARAAGVCDPERVRLLPVSRICGPTDPLLEMLSRKIKFGVSDNTAGLTLGYGIYLKTSELPDRLLITHELVHVAQYERLGGIAPFLLAYLFQVSVYGYFSAPLEREAVRISERIVP